MFSFADYEEIMVKMKLRFVRLSQEIFHLDKTELCCGVFLIISIIALLILTLLSMCAEYCTQPIVKDTLTVQRKLLNINDESRRTRKQDFIDILQSRTYRTCADIFDGKLGLHWTPKQLQYTKIFTTRVRDIVMKYNSGLIEGNSGHHRDMLKLYSEIARLDFIKTVCETGFNAGHSTFMWLNTNPDLVVYSFDIDMHNYTRPLAYQLQSMFPGRLHVTYGDSRLTIPLFHADSPEVKCDLIVIDGGHHFDVPARDFDNFRAMVPLPRENLVILDDWPGREDVNLTIGAMWRERIRAGRVQELFSCLKENNRWESGITLGQYV